MSNIIDYLVGLKNHFTKGDAELDLQYSLQSLENSIKELETLNRVVIGRKLSSKLNQVYVGNFYRAIRVTSIGTDITVDGNFLVDLTYFLRNALANGEYLTKELHGLKGNTILSDTLNYKEANIVRSVQFYFFLSNYTSDLLNIIIANETDEITNRKHTIVPAVVKRTMDVKTIHAYTALVSVFGVKPELFKKTFVKLSTDAVTTDVNDRITDFNDDIKDIAPNVPNDFSGSPVYMIRSAIASWQVARYQKLQEMERLLSTRLANFRHVRDTNGTDPAIEAKIEDYQSRLDGVNRKIAKMEESVK